MRDPYDVLGISRGSSDEEITAQYRKLAKKYHPDLNPNDPVAAEKMAEINAAYDQIKSGQADYQTQQQTYSQNYSDPYNYSTYNFYDFFGFNQRHSQRTDLDSARLFIQSGNYREALYILNQIDNRNAQWYYYSAYANYYTNNRLTALQHAQRAVQLDPNNVYYQQLLTQIRSGQRAYSQHSYNYRNTRATSLLVYLIASVICWIFGGNTCCYFPCCFCI